MREIKFRAWDKKENRMHKVEGFDFENEVLFFEGIVEILPMPFSQCELMQYTGLKDKNGVPIFEGDIVKNRAYNTREVIEYKDGMFSISQGEALRLYTNHPLGNKLEVIGNIY